MTPVSELLALKIENITLKLERLEHAAQQAARQLLDEQKPLIEQARIEVGAPSGHVYNTDTKMFQAPTGPQPLSTPSARQARRLKEAKSA